MTAHVISGLKKKRDELAKQLHDSQRDVERLSVEVRSIDAAILIYDPDYISKFDTFRDTRKNSFFIHGEGVQLIRDFFRGNTDTVPTSDIVTALAAEKQLSIADNKKLYNRFYMSVLRSLHQLARKGELQQLSRERGIIRWSKQC